MNWAIDAELAAIFAAEAEDRLQTIDAGLLALEDGPSPEVLTAVRRDVHSLKGSAKLLGFGAIAELSHVLEDVLCVLADGHRPCTPEVADVLGRSVATLARLVRARAVEPDDDQRGALVALQGLWGDAAAAQTDVAATLVVDSLVVPRQVEVASAAPAGPASFAALQDREPPPAPPGADDEVVRLRATKIYELVDAVGEAGIGARAAQEQARRLQALSRRVDARCRRGGPSDADLAAFVLEVREELSRLARDVAAGVDGTRLRLDDVQAQAMRLAMIPAAAALAPLPRLVRGLGRSLGKEVELWLDDGDCELDKQVADALAEPLRALLLNAIDHGIEDAPTRRALAKGVPASLRVAVRADGGRVRFSVSDDGRGIDPAAVRAKGVAAGILDPDEAFGAGDLARVLCRAGFSTAPVITDVSGRGVGLDVVAQAVARLGGTLEITSEVGVGTTFTLDVPAHLALVEVVMVRLGETQVALPVSVVEEVVAVSPAAVGEVAGRPMLRRQSMGRAELCPLVSLERLLWPAPGDPPAAVTAVVVRAAGRQVAFGIDELCGQAEIVVRSTGTFLPAIDSVTGATILGDGRVVLVLDPVALCEQVRAGAAAQATAQAAEQRPPRRVLVVDDSHPIREMERSILDAAGYVVVTAANGADALAHLAEETFDVVVTDVEMPEIGGLELCARIRSAYGPLPVVMLTSRASDDDRRRGLEVGANAYLSKGSFDQAILVETLEALVG